MYHRMPDQRMNVETILKNDNRLFPKLLAKDLLLCWGTSIRDFKGDCMAKRMFWDHACLGWTAVGEETDNRFLLLDFCRANDLIVANTWLQ